jgi:hypothetical protein
MPDRNPTSSEFQLPVMFSGVSKFIHVSTVAIVSAVTWVPIAADVFDVASIFAAVSITASIFIPSVPGVSPHLWRPKCFWHIDVGVPTVFLSECRCCRPRFLPMFLPLLAYSLLLLATLLLLVTLMVLTSCCS